MRRHGGPADRVGMAAPEDVASHIEQAILDNPDPSVREHEREGVRVERFSPKELLEAQGIAQAQAARRSGGIFYGARINPPG